MKLFSPVELAGMQNTQNEAMQDRARVLHYTPGDADEYGMPGAPAWVDIGEIRCGVEYNKTNFEAVLSQGAAATQVATAKLVIRLPLPTTNTPRAGKLDRIKPVSRFGVPLSPSEQKIFEVKGEWRRGPSGLLVEIERVTDQP